TDMQNSYGLLPNDQKHQLKIYGAYAITPEWMVGANINISSGHPFVCLGKFGPNESDPQGYGDAYHWCGGKPVHPGSTGFTPWTHQYNASVTYSPNWADHKLAIQLQIFNIFNSQTATQYFYDYGTTVNPNPSYGLIEGFTNPRSARLTVTYDW
ncbi:MAG TPA: Oar protein, partial [Rhodanobacteraceae bacterium]